MCGIVGYVGPRNETPIIIDDYSEPEPDVWVARVPRFALRLGKPTSDEWSRVDMARGWVPR